MAVLNQNPVKGSVKTSNALANKYGAVSVVVSAEIWLTFHSQCCHIFWAIQAIKIKSGWTWSNDMGASITLCKKESQLQSKKTDFSQEKSRKSQKKSKKIDFSLTSLDWNPFFLTVTDFLFYRASPLTWKMLTRTGYPGLCMSCDDWVITFLFRYLYLLVYGLIWTYWTMDYF